MRRHRALRAAALALVLHQLRAALRRRRHGLQIQGTICLVTGASSGVGAATAIQLAKKGAAKVILVARNRERLDEVAESVRDAGSTPVVIPTDCSDSEQVDNLCGDVLGEHGIPSLIVHAAGAGRWRRLTETSAEEALACMDAPYAAALLVSRVFLSSMLKLERAHICLIQSPACVVAPAGATAYTSTRFALRGLYEALWSDLYGTSIIVSQVILNEVADSYYFEGDEIGHSRIPSIANLLGAPTACETCAKAIVRAAEDGATAGCSNVLLQANIFLAQCLPGLFSLLTCLTSPGRYALCTEPDRLAIAS